jgi:hypothetical protein
MLKCTSTVLYLYCILYDVEWQNQPSDLEKSRVACTSLHDVSDHRSVLASDRRSGRRSHFHLLGTARGDADDARAPSYPCITALLRESWSASGVVGSAGWCGLGGEVVGGDDLEMRV